MRTTDDEDLAWLYPPGILEPQMRRMAGQEVPQVVFEHALLDDGSVDSMFRISQPVTSAFIWCPPMRDGRLDLRRLGLGVC